MADDQETTTTEETTSTKYLVTIPATKPLFTKGPYPRISEKLAKQFAAYAKSYPKGKVKLVARDYAIYADDVNGTNPSLDAAGKAFTAVLSAQVLLNNDVALADYLSKEGVAQPTWAAVTEEEPQPEEPETPDEPPAPQEYSYTIYARNTNGEDASLTKQEYSAYYSNGPWLFSEAEFNPSNPGFEQQWEAVLAGANWMPITQDPEPSGEDEHNFRIYATLVDGDWTTYGLEPTEGTTHYYDGPWQNNKSVLINGGSPEWDEEIDSVNGWIPYDPALNLVTND